MILWIMEISYLLFVILFYFFLGGKGWVRGLNILFEKHHCFSAMVVQPFMLTEVIAFFFFKLLTRP